MDSAAGTDPSAYPVRAGDRRAIPANAVRLRRDVQTVFTLTAAHAALHLDSRARDTDGYVVATGADYDAARDLVDSILGANVEQIAPPWAQETWEAVPPNIWEEGITYAALGRRLGIGTDAARTRALRLIELGPDRQPRVSLEAARETCPRGQGARGRRRLPAPLQRRRSPRDGRAAIAADHPNRHRKRRSNTTETDRVEEPEPPAEPAAPSRDGSGAGDGSGDRPEPAGPEANGSSAPRSGDLARDEETDPDPWGRKPPGMCHVCEETVGEESLAPATLHGARLKACRTCLQRWPIIRPERPPRRRIGNLNSNAALRLDVDDNDTTP